MEASNRIPCPPFCQVRIKNTLTELEKQFYGSSMAYDKALQGQEDLAAALLRNVYQRKEGKEGAATVLARYVRRYAQKRWPVVTCAEFGQGCRARPRVWSAAHLPARILSCLAGSWRA